MPRVRLAGIDIFVCAARATDANGPTTRKQIRPASLFVRERALEIGKGHLTDEARFGFSAHEKSNVNGSQEPDNPNISGQNERYTHMTPNTNVQTKLFAGQDSAMISGRRVY